MDARLPGFSFALERGSPRHGAAGGFWGGTGGTVIDTVAER
jgi:hypothetical protein